MGGRVQEGHAAARLFLLLFHEVVNWPFPRQTSQDAMFRGCHFYSSRSARMSASGMADFNDADDAVLSLEQVSQALWTNG